MLFSIVPLLLLLFALFAYHSHAIGLFTILFLLFIYHFVAANRGNIVQFDCVSMTLVNITGVAQCTKP